MNMDRILIADDEERIREMIKDYVENEGYIIDEASDGRQALEFFRENTYSLVILDVMMPFMDGWSVCREIRKKSQVPVIMLTARGEEYDKLFGFEMGVDDYIVKPFSPRELLARMRAIIRRSNAPKEGNAAKIATLGGLSINFDSRDVTVDGQLIALTPKEYDLLSFLVRNPNRVFSREQLLNEIWGYEFAGDYRTVDTHIKMLRESLKDYRKLIVTVWGTGYKLDAGGVK